MEEVELLLLKILGLEILEQAIDKLLHLGWGGVQGKIEGSDGVSLRILECHKNVIGLLIGLLDLFLEEVGSLPRVLRVQLHLLSVRTHFNNEYQML